ncbi:MAG TPA: hypothetical protein PLZ36_06735 [Armatimonadota bacterium]|nr:hypothetical protein [Armatimonadota bacterium]HOS43061.1 hypothetical protein [Armatimonadota bacterium]
MSSAAALVVGVLALLFLHRSSPAPVVHAAPGRGATAITTAARGNTVTVDITSEGGIGSATITLGDPRPARLIIRLHLKGLEHFSLTQGDTTLGAAVGSGADHPVRRWIMRRGEAEEAPLAEGSPLWMPLTRGDDAFTLEAPTPLLHGDAAELALHWVDFYR